MAIVLRALNRISDLIRYYILKTIASPQLSFVLSFLGSLFLTKELLYGFFDHILTSVANGQHIRLSALVILLIYWSFFFVMAFVIFRITHTDDFIRRLTLRVIRLPKTYFLFIYAFIKSRVDVNATWQSPKRFFDELNDLFEMGRELFALPHKRSITFLLGISYIDVKNTLNVLQTDLDSLRQLPGSAAAVSAAIQDAKSNLEGPLTKPIKYLDSKRSKASFIHNSYLDNLAFLLDLAREPSFETALRQFSGALSNIATRLGGEAAGGFGVPKTCLHIRDEALEILEVFEERCKARIGYPLFTFIDKKTNNGLTGVMNHLRSLNATMPVGSLNTQLRAFLTAIVTVLGSFMNTLNISRVHFDNALSQLSKPAFSSGYDLICLYGFSNTVTSVLEKTIRHNADRRFVEIIMLKTDKKATTSSEENMMRDELLERSFSNLTIYSFQDLLAIQRFSKRINFMLGFEVINPENKKAIFHFGAGQLLQTLTSRLIELGNEVKVQLVGATYKEIDFDLHHPEIEHSSVFDWSDALHCRYINEHQLVF
ncbi:MAG: hypothetical protein HZA13_09420 [Nitrospirae bacterium]|nr:hypothetical protein [Nitrospirota bacterium]